MREMLQFFVWLRLTLMVCFLSLVFVMRADSAHVSPTKQQKINKIIITGNVNVPLDAIEAKIPYKVGRTFDPKRSSELIRSLYAMGYFKPTISVAVENISPEAVNIRVVLHEKEIVDELVIEGNSHLKREEIDKKTNLADLRSIDRDDLERVSTQIKELYVTKDYHNVQITPTIKAVSPGHVKVIIAINEGKTSAVKRVIFKGNTCVPSKKLRALIFTREDWLLGFLSKAGSYQPEAIEYDKHVIEHYYKSSGFLHAHVDDVLVEKDGRCADNYVITFIITEGDQYTISKVGAQANDLLSEEEILDHIPIRPGQLYSSERIRQAMENLRLLWGGSGYIFAEINPTIEPDEENKTVNVSFATELGNPITCNRITVTGHCKTREHVIRREISINEGDLLTTRDMDTSKEQVERLGFFDQKSGVNWKTTRLNDTQADLDLVVKEIKTGKVFAEIKTGGNDKDFQSPTESVQVGLGARDINFRGTGIKYAASAYFSRQDRQIALNVLDPWIFGKPFQAGFDLFHSVSTYTEFKHVAHTPREHRTGGSVLFGFNTHALSGIACLFDLGFESINYNKDIVAQAPRGQNDAAERGFNHLVNNIFQSGNLLWTSAQLAQDHRNNPMTPTRGYLWTSNLKLGIPCQRNGFGFIKWDADGHWYTPLINDFDLIFHLHGHIGLIRELGSYNIPYRELYHIGGPATVRGFLFGQIGPTLFDDSIGGKKALWVNAEVLFPLTPDFNIVGLVFYDGGAGWDAPNIQDLPPGLLRNNQFRFRQSVGVGIKIRSPIPISIAVGLKLDRNKRQGESASEVHFTSSVDF